MIQVVGHSFNMILKEKELFIQRKDNSSFDNITISKVVHNKVSNCRIYI